MKFLVFFAGIHQFQKSASVRFMIPTETQRALIVADLITQESSTNPSGSAITVITRHLHCSEIGALKTLAELHRDIEPVSEAPLAKIASQPTPQERWVWRIQSV
jgi:hypothetical protein